MDNTQQIFPAFRLVAQFADGQRLTFDGLTEQQAQQSMEAAQAQHGDITWFDGVTDRHYENGRYYKLTTQPIVIALQLLPLLLQQAQHTRNGFVILGYVFHALKLHRRLPFPAFCSPSPSNTLSPAFC